MRHRTAADNCGRPGCRSSADIAGPDSERDEERECRSEGFSVSTITNYGKKQIKAVISDLQDQLPNGLNLNQEVARLQAALNDIEEVDIDGECPFEGDVTVIYYNGVITWECPLCRILHEEESERD